MKLRGIEFGNSFAASGSRGFFGEGYWHHGIFKWLLPGFDFSGSTFIAKTTTVLDRMPLPEEKGKGWGNLPLNLKTWKPIEWFPDCIKVSLLKGEALNAVSLTGPGAQSLFESGRWQKIQNPIVISFMAIGQTQEERINETVMFCNIFKKHLHSFSAPVALQVNISCPNTQHNTAELANNVMGQLEITKDLGIAVGLKINVLTLVEIMQKAANSGLCDFLEIPNTLPFGKMPGRVDWERKYSNKSPLAKYGGGGYSGLENFQLALEWIKNARNQGIRIPIICGGVSCKEDVEKAKRFGADAVAFARITMTPFHAWKIKGIIEKANNIFGGQKK
jgi:dihydroorotate dehydrogenase